ncbi:MAG: hypothetical protein LLG01_14255 [Planctomycetaceae bacterium]|nr:hypothetical protein [Planctomycetaceae bacterium]
MPVLERLLRVGRIADSLGVYLPSMLLQRGMGLLRNLLFMHLIPPVQFNLWFAGSMIFDLGSQVIALGANHGLTRYVSLHEAQGQLHAFYRRMRLTVLISCLLAAATAMGMLDLITQFTLLPKGAAASDYPYERWVCLAALVNALLLALYLNMLGFMYGLRTYRLIAAAETFCGVLFLLLGVAALVVHPSGLAILAAHAISVAAAVVAGTMLLNAAVRRLGPSASQAALQARRQGEVVLDPVSVEDEPEVAVAPASSGHERTVRRDGTLWQLYRFGLIILAGNLLWRVLTYVSYQITDRHYSADVSAIFGGLLRFTQSIEFLATAVFMVVFTHVVRRWQEDRRDVAMSILQVSYKMVGLAVGTVAIIAYVSAPFWVRILPPAYQRDSTVLVGGQLLFYFSAANLSLLNMISRLHERPLVPMLMAGVAGAINLLLGQYWVIAAADPTQGALRAAWAMGVAMFGGGMLVALPYLLVSRCRLELSTYIILLSPAVLLLGPLTAGPVWIALLLVVIFTGWVLDDRQKRLILQYLREAVRSLRRRPAWR